MDQASSLNVGLNILVFNRNKQINKQLPEGNLWGSRPLKNWQTILKILSEKILFNR